MQEERRRPRRITLCAVALALTGVGSALSGIGLTMVSGCCGSPDPADPTPLLAGVVVGIVYVLAASAMWSGSGGRLAVGAMAATGPVACLIAAPFASDFAALFVPALLGWLTVYWLLRSDAGARWFAGAT